MKLFVAVLCYRVPDLTIECLQSLSREIQRVPGTKVGVCENGTGGAAAEQLAKAIEENGWSSWCELTVVYPNRGFTGGNNLIIQPLLDSADPPEYVLLLNADTIVLEHAVESLVQFMDDCPSAGIAGSQLLSRERKYQASLFRFFNVLTEFDRGLRLGFASKLLSSYVAPPPTASSADWVPGACMILRRSMLDEIGLLDEGFYTYFDDIDICLRARRAGWETWYVPQSEIIHFEGAATDIGRTPKRLPSYWFEARRRYFLKNCGKVHTALADIAFLCGLASWRLRRRIQRKPDFDPPHLLADSFRHSVFCSGFELRTVKNPVLTTPEPASISM